jgi:hypothetical protein
LEDGIGENEWDWEVGKRIGDWDEKWGKSGLGGEISEERKICAVEVDSMGVT